MTVLDINDNTPEFTQSEYKADISESAAIGSSVLMISAVDIDLNSRVFYKISGAANAITLDLFEIDSETGTKNYESVWNQRKAYFLFFCNTSGKCQCASMYIETEDGVIVFYEWMKQYSVLLDFPDLWMGVSISFVTLCRSVRGNWCSFGADPI